MVPKRNESEGEDLSLRRRVRRFWIEVWAVNDRFREPPANRPADEDAVPVADRLAERLTDGSFTARTHCDQAGGDKVSSSVPVRISIFIVPEILIYV